MALSKSGVIAISVTFALLSIVLFCAFCAFCLSFTARESLDSSWDIPDFPGDLEEVVLPGDREEVVLPGDRKDVVLQVERTDMYTVGQRIESSTDVVRDRKRAYRRGKEIAMRTYLNKVLRILFIVFGLLTITTALHTFWNIGSIYDLFWIPGFGMVSKDTLTIHCISKTA
jgi:hypothetical protein